MIKLFKTNIRHKQAKNQVLAAIRRQLPGIVATLELDDSEKVLRVVGAWAPVTTSQIVELVQNLGFSCEVLQD